MPYSVGNSQLPVLQDNTASTIGAMGDAFKAMNNSFDKIANLPWLARGLVQENADARYSAALNKYSNDPDGLAKALANGDIDTSNVTANTLNQTQDRLKDIGNNYSRSYIQSRAENLNKYLEGQGGKDYLTAVGLAQQGKDISNLRNNANAPAEAIPYWDKLNPMTQQNVNRQLAQAGAALAYQRGKDAIALKGRQGLFAFNRLVSPFNQDPTSYAKVLTNALSTGHIDVGGQDMDISGILSDIVADPNSYKQFQEQANFYNPVTKSANPTALQAAAPQTTAAEKASGYGLNIY